MINHYELLYLVGANYTEEELVPLKEKVKQLVKKFEGEITLEDSLGKKKLAYPINKDNQGHYLLYEFDLDGEKLKDLDKELKLTNEVMRHIIVKRKLKTPSLLKTTAEKIKKEEKKEALEKTEPIKDTEKKQEKDNKSKIKLEDLDKKLDEILDGDIM